jgi:outer membrane protein assembly factor BamB
LKQTALIRYDCPGLRIGQEGHRRRWVKVFWKGVGLRLLVLLAFLLLFLVVFPVADRGGRNVQGWSVGARVACKFSVGSAINSSPLVVNTPKPTVYFGSDDGKLWAIDLEGCAPAEGDWPFITGGPVRSSPAERGGIIYVSSDLDIGALRGAQGQVLALTSTGKLLWRFVTGGAVKSSPAVGTDGTTYVGADDGNLYAIGTDGRLKWAFPGQPEIRTGFSIVIAGPIRSSPRIGPDGTIYVGADNGAVYALLPAERAEEGGLKAGNWPFHTGPHNLLFVEAPPLLITLGPAVRSSPAIGQDGTIYIGADDGNLYAIAPDGTERWRFHTGGEIHSSPDIGEDGKIYFGSSDGYLYALNPDGKEHCRLRTGGSIHSSPRVYKDDQEGTLVFVGSDDGRLYIFAINAACRTLLTYSTEGPVRTKPAVREVASWRLMVIFGSQDGNLYILNFWL